MTLNSHIHPIDPAGTEAPDEKPSAVEDAASEAITPASDPLVQAKADLEAAKAEAAEWRDRFLRKAAEFDNYRKRMDRERSDSAMLARSSLLFEFLPLADACERALESFAGAGSDEQGMLVQYREGVELLYRQLLDTLTRFGVAPIEAAGKKFDPHIHEALAKEATSQYEENTVIQELRRGYLFKGRLLRPAQVIVASKRPEEIQA